VAAPPATVKTCSGAPAGNAFYMPPNPLPPGQHGDIIWRRPPGQEADSARPVFMRLSPASGHAYRPRLL